MFSLKVGLPRQFVRFNSKVATSAASAVKPREITQTSSKPKLTKLTRSDLDKIPTIYSIPNVYNSKRSSYKPKHKPVLGLVYHPAPSAPSFTSITPDAFMPDNDPRKGLNLFSPKVDVSNAPVILPKHLGVYGTTKITPEMAYEIRKLRSLNENKFTPRKLARRFKTSRSTILQIAPSSFDRLKEMSKRKKLILQRETDFRKLRKKNRSKLMELVRKDL